MEKVESFSPFVHFHLKSVDNVIWQHDPTAWRLFELLLVWSYPNGVWSGGRFELAKKCGFKNTTTYEALKRLAKAKMLTLTPNNRYTTYSICNWGKYQNLGNTKPDNRPTTDRQQTDTYNVIGEVRVKSVVGKFDRDYVTSNMPQYQLKYPKVDVQHEWEQCENYYGAHGIPIKDWNKAFWGWLGRARSPKLLPREKTQMEKDLEWLNS